jgi:Fe-S-cluster containining protein
MSKVHHFTCVGCGRCCNSPPQMAVEEALRLYDVFPLAVQVNAYPVVGGYRSRGNENTDMRKAAEQLRDNALALGGAHVTRTTATTYVLTLGANAIDPADEPCPMLAADGRCTTHDRRPVMCRSVPFNPEIDPRLSIRIFRQQHQHDCDWSTTGPVLMRDGKIADPQYAMAYAAAREAQRRDSELLRLLREHDGDGFNELVGQVFSNGYEARLPFDVLLEMMRRLDRVGQLPAHYVLPSANDYYAAQLKVLRHLAAFESGRAEAARDAFRSVAAAYEAAENSILRAREAE